MNEYASFWEFRPLWNIMRHRWKIIGGVSFVVGIATYLAMRLIAPLYEGQAVFYPANPQAITTALTGESSEGGAFLEFGSNEVVEQFLQILRSSSLRQALNQQFHLAKHYGIDINQPKGPQLLDRQIEKRIKVRRSQFSSIIIEVWDESPDTAALLANAMMTLADSLKGSLIQHRAQEAFQVIEKRYRNKQREVQTLVDSLQTLGKMGVLNYEDQSASYAESWGKALSEGRLNQARRIEEKMKLLGQYGPIQYYLSQRLRNEMEAFLLLQQHYEKLKTRSTERISTIFVIDRARPMPVPVWPRRLLMAGLATGCSMAILLLFFLIRDSKSRTF